MMKKITTFFLLVFSVMLLLMPHSFAYAQGQPENEGGSKSGNTSGSSSNMGQDFGLSQGTANLKLRNDTPAAFIGTVIRWVLGVLGVVLLAIMVYAGSLYATAAGNEDQTATAKKALTYAIIGLVLVVAAFLISDFVIAALEAPAAETTSTL